MIGSFITKKMFKLTVCKKKKEGNKEEKTN